ncbi:MAG: hypothetical protein GQ559_01765 [Desulfobulbaceae bacterium]|nr:hypothetical protein [Desulfobulbaceae bacterium]
MSLVNIDSVRRQVLRILDKIEPPGGVELLSYKRNRSVALVCQSPGEYLIREQGYVDQEILINRQDLARILKTMIKREFPRSRKVRLHKFDHPEELERARQKI